MAHLTVHAIERIIERVDPGLSYDQAAALLARIAARIPPGSGLASAPIRGVPCQLRLIDDTVTTVVRLDEQTGERACI